MLTKAELPDCPVATTLQLIGNKWKMLILRNLMTRPWRFNEMLRSIPGISQKSTDRQPPRFGKRCDHHQDGFP